LRPLADSAALWLVVHQRGDEKVAASSEVSLVRMTPANLSRVKPAHEWLVTINGGIADLNDAGCSQECH
jgi:hypothetical protein